jgi:RNA polymerase sigma-70 factor (ECF subfamily)
LVARYTVRAHRAAFLLGAGEEADDIVQEAFVKAFRHLRRFRTGEPFGPWLLSIVSNETKNRTRSRLRRTALSQRLAAAQVDRAAGPDPVEEVLAGERRAELLDAVNALPERERRVVTCRYFLARTARHRQEAGQVIYQLRRLVSWSRPRHPVSCDRRA